MKTYLIKTKPQAFGMFVSNLEDFAKGEEEIIPKSSKWHSVTRLFTFDVQGPNSTVK